MNLVEFTKEIPGAKRSTRNIATGGQVASPKHFFQPTNHWIDLAPAQHSDYKHVWRIIASASLWTSKFCTSPVMGKLNSIQGRGLWEMVSTFSTALREELRKSYVVLSWQRAIQCRHFENKKRYGLRNCKLLLLSLTVPKKSCQYWRQVRKDEIHFAPSCLIYLH